MEGEQRRGKLLAIFSVHGGVGKSLLAANIGVILARQTRQEIGLADLHLGGGATLAQQLRLTHEVGVIEWFSRIRQHDKWAQEYFASHPSGLRLLTGTYDAGRARCLRWEVLQAGLGALQDTFPLTIIDLHPVLDMPALCVLKNSDLILFVVRIDGSAWAATVHALAMLKLLQIPEQKVRLVASPVGFSRSGVRTISQRVMAGPELYPVLVWDPQTVADAQANGQLPADLPDRPLTRALQAIARRVQEELLSTASSVEPTSDEAGAESRVAEHRASADGFAGGEVSEEQPAWEGPRYPGARLHDHWRRCRELAYDPASARRKRILGSVILQSKVAHRPDRDHPKR
ncbi:MAG: hypothetical protein IMX00_06640 [Limnochordales bacterium]|nr:hypothetical protein [Limnochordales bacterium]